MKHTNRSMLFVVASSALLAGCGGGGGDGAGPSAIAGATEVAAAPQTAAVGGSATNGMSTPGGGAATAPRTAKECLDPRAFQPGYRVRVALRSAQGTVSESEMAHAGTTLRNGRTVAVFRTDLPMSNGAAAQYLFREFTGSDVLEHGLRLTAQADGRHGVIDTLPTAGIAVGFALPVGGSASSGTVSIATSARVTGEPDRDQTVVAQYQVRFVGFETITTPAGRFVDTCRIATTETRDGATTTTTTWWGNGLGLPVQMRDAAGATTQVVAIAINGGVIAGRFGSGTTTPTTPAPGPSDGGLRR